jgi:hypothetical protein
MPTNVPPQYRDAEERFRRAGTTWSSIAALEEMVSIMPKHKGTDHLKAQLRARLSKLTAELEGATAGRSGGRTLRKSLRRLLESGDAEFFWPSMTLGEGLASSSSATGIPSG